MNLRDKYENGSILSEEYVLPTIIRLGINKQIPIFLFLSMSSVQFLNKLIPIHTQIDKEKLKDGDLSPEEWNGLDQKTYEICNAPLWLNDIEVNSVDDYKSAEEVIVNEKIKYVFIDSLPETIDKSEIIKWSEKTGFNVYFTNFTLE
ncbi:MAG: hypothetical protein IKY99_00385 [Bacteroidaceae bacterium]|nr:hypothetical protein [Bacteroidaceae bacterium]